MTTPEILLGPVLYADSPGTRDGVWAVRVLVVFDAKSPPTGPLHLRWLDDGVARGAPFAQVAQGRFGTVWLASLQATRGQADVPCGYDVMHSGVPIVFAHPTQLVVPALGAPPRIAFFSCNGVDDPKKYRKLDEPQELWTQMRHVHAAAHTGFHLLIGGGDQVYADSVWDRPLKGRYDSNKSLRGSEPSQKRYDDLVEWYMNLYVERWGRAADMSAMLAAVPSVMTWDDHDIFDGWGSHAAELQKTAVFGEIFDAASRAFWTFQRGLGDPGSTFPAVGGVAPKAPAGSSIVQHLSCGPVEIVVLDSRRFRDREQVLGDAQWAELDRLFAGFANTVEHILVVSSVPVVFVNSRSAARALQLFPGTQSLEDDLLDQWEHESHLVERTRLAMFLLRHAHRIRARVTIVSGDVHVASRGRIRSTRPDHVDAAELESTIHQVTSSAIVYPPPGPFESFAIAAATSDGPEEIASGVRTELEDVRPNQRVLPERNWLTIVPRVEAAQVTLEFAWRTAARTLPGPVVRPRTP